MSQTLHCTQQMHFPKPVRANKAALFIFILLVSITYGEDLSFYFSLHEDRTMNGIFITTTYTDDVISCARACAIEFNCNTASYRTTEKKCDLSKERVDSSTNGAAMVTLKGCYLIEKVRVSHSLLGLRVPFNSVFYNVSFPLYPPCPVKMCRSDWQKNDRNKQKQKKKKMSTQNI